MKRKRYTQPEKPHELDTLKLLTTPAQYEVITDAMLGEEGDHFIEIIDRIHATWQAMPKTYETDGCSCRSAGGGRSPDAGLWLLGLLLVVAFAMLLVLRPTL